MDVQVPRAITEGLRAGRGSRDGRQVLKYHMRAGIRPGFGRNAGFQDLTPEPDPGASALRVFGEEQRKKLRGREKSNAGAREVPVVGPERGVQVQGERERRHIAGIAMCDQARCFRDRSAVRRFRVRGERQEREEELQRVGGKLSLQSKSGDVGSRLGQDTFGDGEFLHPGFKEHASCVSSEQRGEDGVGVDDEPRGLS